MLLTQIEHIESTYFLYFRTWIDQIKSTVFYDKDIISLPWNMGSGTQDINWFHKLSKWSLGNDFVKKSATCYLVDICSIFMVLFTTYHLKWFNLTDKCLVRTHVLWLVSISMKLFVFKDAAYNSWHSVRDREMLWLEYR